MKTEDFDWCNDSGYSDVFNNSLCECTAPQVNDDMCICGRPINDNMNKIMTEREQEIQVSLQADKMLRLALDMIENNKLIAEFMGYENVGTLSNPMYEYGESGGCRSLEDIYYHSSWDWLMPVVKKCLIGEAEQDEQISNTTIKNIYEGICNQDISYAYKSVVEFINQLNNNNNE
tara:strand:+ start:288 stop:812 length:525 start_codon:yes stop_codon:yes gene_type:complete